MPYVKEKYINGAKAPLAWYEQARMYPKWYNQATMYPVIPANGFTGYKYNYIPDKKEKEEKEEVKSNLINYNDPLEINSLRDIIFGSSNRNLKHTLNTGYNVIDRNALFNMVADTIVHSYSHFIKPTLTGHGGEALLNVLMSVGEDLDFLANPVKAAAQAIYKGENIGQAVQRATVGDKTGIHNYDWDTGNGLADLGLELISDPLNWISWGGKAILSKTIDSGVDAALKSGKKVIYTGAKELAQELTEKTGKHVYMSQVYDLTKELYESNVRKTLKKQIAYNASDIVKAKKLLSTNIEDSILDAVNKKFTRTFTKNLRSITNTTDLDEAAIIGFLKGVEKINKNVLTRNAADIVNSLGLKMMSLEDDITRAIFKADLSVSGIYPAYRALRNGSKIQKYFDNKIMRKAQQNTANEVLGPKEAFVNAKDYDGVIQTIQEEINLRNLLPKKYRNMILEPEYEATLIAEQVALRIAKAKELFNTDSIKNPGALKRAILNTLQSIDSHTKFNNMEDVQNLITNLEQEYFKAAKDNIINTEFTSVKLALEELADDFNKLDEMVTIQKNLNTDEQTVKFSQEILRFTKTLSEYKKNLVHPESFNINKIFKKVPYTQLYLEMYNVAELLKQQGVKGLTTKNLTELLNILNRIPTLNEDAFDRMVILIKKLINKVLEFRQQKNYYRVNQELSKLQDVLIRFQKNTLPLTSKKHMLNNSFINILLPIDPNTNKRIVNQYLIDTIKSAKYNTEYPNDFLKTDIYNDALRLVKQSTDRQKRYDELAKALTNTKKMNKVIMAQNSERIKELSQLGDERLIKTDIYFKDQSQSISEFAHNTIDIIEDRLYKTKKEAQEFYSYFVVAEDEAMDLTPSSAELLQEIYDQLARDTSKMITIIKRLDRAKDITNFKAMYYDLAQCHSNLKRTLDQLRTFYKKLPENAEDIKFAVELDYPFSAIEETLVNSISPEIIDRKILQLNNDTYYGRFQLEKVNVQNRFNNLRTLGKIKQDVQVQNLVNTVINAKSSAKLQQLFKEYNIDENTQEALICLAVIQQDITNSNQAVILFDHFVDTLDVLAEEKKTIKTAIHTSLDYAKRKDLVKANAENLTTELVKNVQGYVTGADLTSKKQNLDAILSDIARNESRTIEEIEQEIMEQALSIAGVDPSIVTRHSALYDTVAQIYAYEHKSNKKFVGNMLDIESTKLLNKYNQTNGAITEITVVSKNEQGELLLAYNKRIQVTQETLQNRYMQTIPYLEKLEMTKGLTIADHKAKYVADADKIMEQDVLSGFLDWLEQLPSKTNLSTFNGDDFDLLMLNERMKTVLSQYNFLDILNDLDVQDHYKIFTKDRFRFTQQQIAQIKNIFEKILHTQHRTLGKYRLLMNYPISVIGGVDRRFIDTAKRLLNIDTLAKLDKSIPEQLDFAFSDHLEFVEQEEAVLNVFSKILELSVKNKIKDEIFLSISNPTIREYMYDLLTEYIDEARNVKFENQALKDILVPGDMFDESLSSNVQKRIIKDIQDQIIDSLPDGPYKTYLKQNAKLATNLTQLLSLGLEGDPLYAYKKYDKTILKLWDQTKEVFTTNNIDTIYSHLRTIINNNDKIYNVDCIIDFKNQIYDMLHDIQLKGLTADSRALVIDTENLQFAYSELDFLWKQIRREAEFNKFNPKAVQELQQLLIRKYPELIALLDNGTPYIKVSLNTHGLDFIMPRTVKWTKPNSVDLFTSFKTVEDKISSNINNLNKFFRLLGTDTSTSVFNIQNLATTLVSDFRVFKENLENLINNIEYILEDPTLKFFKDSKAIKESLADFKELNEITQQVLEALQTGQQTIEARIQYFAKHKQGLKTAKDLRLTPELTNVYRTMKDENRIFKSFMSKKKQAKYKKLLEPFKDFKFDMLDETYKTYQETLDIQGDEAYKEMLALKDLSNKVNNKIKAFTDINTDAGLLGITKESRTAGILHQKLIDMRLNNKDHKISNMYRSVGISTTYLRAEWAINNILNCTPEQLLSEIIYANKHHILTINQPTNNNYFNNLYKFKELFTKEKQKALKDLGIKIVYDKNTNKLILGIDPKMSITLNKNRIDGARYCLNGKVIQPNIFESIPYDVYLNYVSGPKEYVDTMYEWLIKLEHMDPELKGRFGITNYAENYDKLMELKTYQKLSTANPDDTYMPFLNQSFIGDYNTLQQDVGHMYADALYLFSNTSSKITTQIAKHLEYGQFIMDGGLRLGSEILQNTDPTELNNWLNKNPNYVAVYLADAKRAIGGFEIRRINYFDETTLKEAKRLNASIIPYQQYVRSAEHINNYHYNNNLERILGKITSAYKAGWLAFSPGLIIRNIIDSAMKNYIEGEDIPGITMRYIQAFDLYHKYTKVMNDILKMDENNRYTLDNAKTYFKQENRLLDFQTYHLLYNFMNENGMNTLKTGAMDIYSWAMSPMNYVEKINRLVQYLNLEEQGVEYSEIIRRIAETHFDYSTKTQFDFITQIYIPFWTYASNNILYVAHLIDEHPSFLRNYFNVYTPIWDFDSIAYEELAQNQSLQNQIIAGNIPLKFFGYKDKEIERTVDTKYGPREQTVTNTAVLKMGASILDGFNFFTNPYTYIKEKLAPPYQTIIDTLTEYTDTAIGNIEKYKWSSQQDTEEYYNYNFGSTSVQSLFKNPEQILRLAPGATAVIPNNNLRTLISSGLNAYTRIMQSKVEERTDNKIISKIPSVFGATSRWGEFKQNSYTPKSYSYPKTFNKSGYKKYTSFYSKSYPTSYRLNGKGQSVKYYLRYPQKVYFSGRVPYTSYQRMLSRIYSPNTAHRHVGNFINSNMQTIPQYLYSYAGRNRQGKSKLLSWARMNTRFKVKSTLRRIATP